MDPEFYAKSYVDLSKQFVFTNSTDKQQVVDVSQCKNQNKNLLNH